MQRQFSPISYLKKDTKANILYRHRHSSIALPLSPNLYSEIVNLATTRRPSITSAKALHSPYVTNCPALLPSLSSQAAKPVQRNSQSRNYSSPVKYHRESTSFALRNGLPALSPSPSSEEAKPVQRNSQYFYLVARQVPSRKHFIRPT